MTDTISKRPLTKDEAIILKGYSAQNYYSMLVKAYFFGILVFGALAFCISFSLWKWLAPYAGVTQPQQQKFLFCVLSFLAVSIYFGLGELKRSRSLGKKRRSGASTFLDIADKAGLDLQSGTATVLKLHVTEAVELEEFEDEGAGFFLALTDNRVLFLRGQDLYDYAHDAKEEAPPPPFPSTEIIYSYAENSCIRLGIKGCGAPLKAQRRVKAGKYFYSKNGYTGPEDGQFYDGDINSVLKKFNLKT